MKESKHLTSCNLDKDAVVAEINRAASALEATTTAALGFPSPESYYQKPNKENSVFAVLWQQFSTEYRALCYQAFLCARHSLDRQLEEAGGEWKKPPAIITDIDESILDNSAYNAKLINTDLDYNPATWTGWTDLEAAPVLPGALEFFRYAVEDQNVEVFYITNRSEEDALESTKNNLKEFGFPHVDDDHMLLKTDTSSKTERRNKVLGTNTVLLYIGDNASDFHDDFETREIGERRTALENHRGNFGAQFIVLPNPMYGSWESALYGERGLTNLEKEVVRKQTLRSF